MLQTDLDLFKFVGFGLIFGKVYKENYKISSSKEARPWTMTISTAGAVSSARAERATSVDLEVGISCFYVTYTRTLVSATTEEFITNTIL